jgi:hypothetical protein
VTYDSEVLADSPAWYLKTDETSGTTLADSSGNGRDMTIAGTPTLGATGPSGAADAVDWPASTVTYANVAGWQWESGTNGFTIEAWVYLTANPAAVAAIVGEGNFATGTSNTEYGLSIDTTGHPVLYMFNTGVRLLTGSALSLNAWHHVVAVCSSSTGMRFRIDKVADGTLAQNALAPNYQRIMWVHGSGRSNGGGAVRIAKPAFYSDALTDTRIDAHYDAMGVGGGTTTGTFSATLPTPVTAAFTGTYRESGTFSATLPQITASLSGTYTAPPTGTFAATLPSPLTTDFAGTYTAPANPTGSFAATLPTVAASFAGDYHPHEAGTFDAVLPFPTADFTGTYTPGLETGSFTATLPVVTADFAGTYSSPSGTTGTFAASLPLVVAAFTGTYDGPIPTDTSNALNGRVRHGSATVTITRPVAAVPPSVSLGERYDKALAFPEPVMDNGRPT